MKKVYWEENKRYIDLSYMEQGEIEALYKNYNSKNKPEEKLHFLCPHCRQARYTLRSYWSKQTLQYTFAQSFKQTPHSGSCTIFPENAVNSFKANKRLCNVDIVKNNRFYVLDIRRAQGEIISSIPFVYQGTGEGKQTPVKEYPNLYVKQTYRTFAEVFRFWYVNMNKFINHNDDEEESTLFKQYSNMVVKTVDGEIKISDLFLDPIRAHQYYSLPHNRRVERFIYARVIRIKANKTRPGDIIFDLVPIKRNTVCKTTHLHISAAQLKLLPASVNDGRPFNVLFYAHPWSLKKGFENILTFSLEQDDAIGVVSNYIADNGDFVDSWPELVITNKLIERNIPFVKPGQPEATLKQYSVDRCDKEFSGFVPDWIITLPDRKPIILEYYGYRDNGSGFVQEYRDKKKRKEQFYATLNEYDYLGIDVEELIQKHICSSSGRINHYILFHRYIDQVLIECGANIN